MNGNYVPFLSQKAKSVMASHSWRTVFLQETVEEVGSQPGSWPLDTTNSALQCKTRVHFSIRSFSPENPLSTIHHPIRYVQIIHHLEAQSEQNSQLNLQEEERNERSWTGLKCIPHPLSCLPMNADGHTTSPEVQWLFPNVRPLMTKLKHPTPLLCNGSTKKHNQKKHHVSEIKAASVGTLSLTIKIEA